MEAVNKLIEAFGAFGLAGLIIFVLFLIIILMAVGVFKYFISPILNAQVETLKKVGAAQGDLVVQLTRLADRTDEIVKDLEAIRLKSIEHDKIIQKLFEQHEEFLKELKTQRETANILMKSFLESYKK